MATRYDIVVPKKYTKDGVEKTAWKNVGTLVHFPATEDKEEGYIMEMSMFPDTTFKVFKQKPKEAVAPKPATEEIDADSIPF